MISGRKLPPMRTERHSSCAVSYRDHLLVAGGVALGVQTSNVVEVYNGSDWLFAQPLLMSNYDLKSTILGQYWYLMGGNDTQCWNAVQYASLDSLLAGCQPSETSQLSSAVWKRLTDTPHPWCSTAVFGSRLIAVGGGGFSPMSTVCAYSFQTNSWIHVGDMPFAASSTCSVVLPTGELMVMGGQAHSFLKKNVLKATIKGN